MTLDQGLGRRLATAAVLLPLFVLTIVVGGWVFLVVVVALAVAGIAELYAFAREKPYRPRWVPGMALGAALPVLLYAGPADPWVWIAVMTAGVAAVAAAQMLDPDGTEAMASVGFTLLGALYAGLLFGHMVLLREMPREMAGASYRLGAILLMVPLVLTWLNDTVAYFAGRRWGRRRLLPRVSPGKSWEGALAALVGSAVAGTLLLPALGLYGAFHGLAVGALVGVVSPLGDLVESAFKRDAGVKDSSGLVPGHGGILDRFDAALFTVPAFYWYLRCYAP
ncbi:MAG TPA: phosphatidate cytidylyltransferase [Gemmatimonadota bacterium]|nr:phosphatidate cytidylyltransferase [Gemmatimonadota bacterium]